MNKFIRTKDGVYETIREILDGEAYEVKVPQSRWDYDEDNHCYWEDSKIDGFNKKDVIKEADTIEELFMPNDLLVVGDDKNQMPIFIESIEYLNSWLFCHDIYHIKEFYIKDGNDFRCIARETGKKHKLILI